MKEICVKFVDFGPAWDPHDNLLVRLMSRQCSVKIVEENPTYLFHSVHPGRTYEGSDHFSYMAHDCVKIFYTGENVVPDFNSTDYAMAFDYLDFGDRYLRFPNYFGRILNWKLEKEWTEIHRSEALQRQGFCNFVYSNGANAAPEREQFFWMLSKYKPVDSAGRYLRNTDALERIDVVEGKWGEAKKLFLNRYKFTIAFENDSHPGYTTEKILDAFAARSVPIYWGSNRVGEEFNPKSFINAHEFGSLDDLVQEVIRLDQDDDAYMAMVNANPLMPRFASGNPIEESFDAFFKNIIDQEPEDARRRSRYAAAKFQERTRYLRAQREKHLSRNKLMFWKR